MRRTFSVCLVVLLLPMAAFAQNTSSDDSIRLPGLLAPARIVRDSHGLAHIRARNDHDLYFLQGYAHAQDRLFQMDASRREASGTLAELLGPAALPQDVQLRAIGLRRAAVRSLAVISPRARAALTAYADGVNAFVATGTLPAEYRALKLTKIAPWTPLDSLAVAKLIAFGLSFDLDIDSTITLVSYQTAGALLGFNGTKLFFEDLVRSAPFDRASTIPDASRPPLSDAAQIGAEGAAASEPRPEAASLPDARTLDARTVELAREYSEEVKDMPVFERLRELRQDGGSNQWAVSGELTENGFPLLANDPHLALGTPSTFYPVHLNAGKINVIGSGFAGVPSVIVGHNRFISWGATVNPLDVTDTFQERIVPDPASPSGLSTIYKGAKEPIIPIPEIFRTNNPAAGGPDNISVVPPGGPIPAATLIVPRRNNGPIIKLDLNTGVGLSVQYTGFSGTREVDTFLIWNEAENLNDFRRGLSFFSIGSQNFAYSDVHGNIAYLTSSEMPIREDLQAGFVNGLPPVFIRNGTGGNEWLPVAHPQPNQATPYEILPFDEMPHIINPPAGFFVNANNDPVGITLGNNPLGRLRPGGGIYYLNYTYSGGFRAGRITARITEKLASGQNISFTEMQAIQADVKLLDAQVFVPHILNAFANAKTTANPLLAALAANPGVVSAVNRLGAWDFSTPTGIPEGFNASHTHGQPVPPTPEEIAASVATTIYSAWRSRLIANTVDAVLDPAQLPRPPNAETLKALRNLLENFTANNGRGASGVNFFNVPGVLGAADRRDIILLKSLADALALLRSPAFVRAFGGSANQDDYRWGKLHRVVFRHRLGEPFSIPPAGGAFPQPLAGLPGIPTDGGFEVIDASSHSARAAGENEFMFSSGPNNRFVSEASDEGMRAESVWPGGTSGVLGSPFYFNMLLDWLTNDAFPLLFSEWSWKELQEDHRGR